MSGDLDVLELLRTEPAPAMHVDLDAVLAEARRRQTRRTARWLAVGATAAAAAVVVAVLAGQPPTDGRTAPPAGNSSGGSGTTVGPVQTHTPGVTWQPESADLSGSATLTAPGGSYSVSVERGVLSVAVTRDGHHADPLKAALLGGGGAWRVVDGTAGARVLVGVAPAGASQVTYLPVAGQAVQPHQVSTAPAGDFTAYLLTFTDPPSAATIAADVGWRFPADPTTHWSLAIEGQQPDGVGFGVSMAGEAATPLTSDGFTRTGPPAGSTPASVVLSILMGSPRLGSDVQAQLQADVVVTDPAALVATLDGADPETALAYRTFQVKGGPSILWGVLPPGATAVTPHLEGGARAGVPVMQRMVNGNTAFAVMVQGTPDQVTGLEATLGGGRGRLGVLQ
jgi:hypothetical protein